MPTDAQNAEAALDTESQPSPNATKKGPGRDPALIARDELLARMDERIMADRAADDVKFWESADVDPRAAALAAAQAKEARGQPLDVDRGHRDLIENRATDAEAEPTQIDDGAAAVQPFEDAAATRAKEAVRISNKGEDPLGEYVVRVDGKPMFKTLVDGREQLIPLDRARQQLQKHLAADIRLQQATEQKRQLDAREQSIRNVEATLKTRSAQPVAPVVDDGTLDREATELVRSLVSEPEGKAAARLAKTLKTIRASQPQVDVGAIEQRAAERAVKTIAERDNQKALHSGFDEFTKNYPDIAGDSDLFTLADRKTNDIAAANPTWTPGQVMNEAGKQTRDWLKSIGVAPKTAAPKSESTNQQRKQNLVPMPQARTVRPAVAKTEEADDSPQNIMAELRKSRGQPY